MTSTMRSPQPTKHSHSESDLCEDAPSKPSKSKSRKNRDVKKRRRIEFPRPKFSETAFDVADDGATLIAYSNPTGLASVSHLRFHDAMAFNRNQTVPFGSVVVEHGIYQGRFMPDSSKFVLCDNAGYLSVYTKKDTWRDTHELFYNRSNEDATKGLRLAAKVHRGAAHAVDVLWSGSEIVSGGVDQSIKITDPNTLATTMAIEGAHEGSITGLAANKRSQNAFVSCGEDGQIALWDVRSPCKELSLAEGASPSSIAHGGPPPDVEAVTAPIINCPDRDARCISWTSDTCLVVGYENGKIIHMDISMPNAVCDTVETTFRIRKICFNEAMRCIAACGESESIFTYKLQHGVVRLETSYNPFGKVVTGLAWDPTEPLLYSCSWQGKVHKKKIWSSR